MSGTKENIFDIVRSTATSNQDTERWFQEEISELGIKHNGLDEISRESALVLSALYTFGILDYQDISKHTGLDADQIGDYLDSLEDHHLICEDLSSGKHKTTKQGENACIDLYKAIVTRKRFELKRDFEWTDHLYQKMVDL